ncbi:ATP-dependent helicase hrpA [Klebsiella pneumoniae subsp. rhinoscleromatis]|nr:ATP-dependent helicase hrpA [Klebsiella pneumoniae subsp. rhinoscleromatis]
MSGKFRDTADALNKLDLRHTEVLPLYARLSNSEQNRVFQPHSGRRIVLATNVAETSLTVPGIKYVIDPGTARISRYSYRTKVQRLPIEPVSQASANQRKGPLRPRFGRDLYSSLFRRRFPVAPGITRPGDSAHQPGVGHPADDRPGLRRYRRLPVCRSAG